ncbi:Bifunctional NMN adenylyltransferase/Nudix hydrolase [Planctomycetes bacterium Poly30]|uniref:Bifunctional NMN adenylyltransferase/Nudix hydrolase n=1 Tax=Saltatorellus ferox TaxID=2528018 RepID=A0A518EKL2_9BACT|nr:Bifunctional NMN adenylyltransferase/Nudix hydrolase [Planctomycetes bacterium Poly30]
MSYSYEYPRPSVTVDAVVFGYDAGELRVLLIERGEEPFRGAWALPGGFVGLDEDLDAAARRELREETGIEPVLLEQLRAFGTRGRDPRGHTVTVAFVALVKLGDHSVQAATDAADARWFPANDPPALAFDHAAILQCARAHMIEAVRTRPVGFDLLPAQFSQTDLQKLVESVLGEELDKRNFRKKLHALGLLLPTGEYETGVPRRAAQLYRFDAARYASLLKEGFQFRL